MTVPWPEPGGSPHHDSHPYWTRDYEPWAIEQERFRRDEALYQVGEYALFVLMWHEVDYRHGLVKRCPVCFTNPSHGLLNEAASVYNQPTKNKCPACFGTTFEGGIRAKIVRPLIISDTDETDSANSRGEIHPDTVNAETTYDFRSYQGDYVFRVDGTRWRILRQPNRTMIRTGFGEPSQEASGDGYSRMTLGFEQDNTVAYMIPPSTEVVKQTLQTWNHRYPYKLGSAPLEEINGPLIPDEQGVLE